MTLRLRQLKLIVDTDGGRYGVEIPFAKGLTVISAENTRGKSTCMMAVLYALGLEGMLGPSHALPFAAAVIDKLRFENEEFQVVGSQVRLEIENANHEIVTLQRSILSQQNDRKLVRVEFGPALTHGGQYDRRDYYVRIQQAARSLDGFHRFLADFIGFELPEVNAADQKRVPLYLECVFPFFFVEQISGWRDVKSRMPTYLSIPDMAKRATEFILELDILRKEVERQSLALEKQALLQEWRETLDVAKKTFSGTGGILSGLTENPTDIWPMEPAPRLLTLIGEKWLTPEEAEKTIVDHYNEIVDERIPKAEEASEKILKDMGNTELEIKRTELSVDKVLSDIASESATIVSIDERLKALGEDLEKYESTRRLISRNGLANSSTINGACPTCGQSLKDMLLPQDRPTNPMSIEENILFLRDQIKLFSEMREESRQLLVAKDHRSKRTETKTWGTDRYASFTKTHFKIRCRGSIRSSHKTATST